MIHLDFFLLRYLQVYVFLPAALLVLILVAYDVLSFHTFQEWHSRGGVYWLCTKSLVFFDRLADICLISRIENDTEWRCLWYRVHIAHAEADLPKGRNVASNQRGVEWRQINDAIYCGNLNNHILELNQLLWTIAKCCLIRLQETPQFLHEDYPQPRCVLHAFYYIQSELFLCQRLESLLILLGVAQIHSSGLYSVRRFLRQNTLPQDIDYPTSRSTWRFNLWASLMTKHRQQLAPMFFPSISVHLVLHPSLPMELLSSNDVVASYIIESKTLLEASQQFVRYLFDALALVHAPKKALSSLKKFEEAILATLPRPSGEIPTLCDEGNTHHCKSISSIKQLPNLDFVETQGLLGSAYLWLGAHEKGLHRIKVVCEMLNESLSKTIQEISYSLRSLALVAWARNNVEKHGAQEQNHDSAKPDTLKLIGEELFSLHLELKMSPTEGKLLEAAAPLSGALSRWQRRFAEYSQPPCWTKCKDELMSLIRVSRIGLDAFDSLSKHFFADSVIKHARSNYARIYSTLSETFL